MKHNRSIKNAGWAVGTYCNANCKHCYSKTFRNHCNPLTYKEILYVLDKLKGFGIETLNIGGNEPIFTDGNDTSKSKLPFIIKEAKKRGLILGITTNGTTVDYLIRNHFEEFKMVDEWDLSLDSPFQQEHDENRGIKLYNLVITSLNHLKLQKVNFSIVMCLMNWNSTPKHAELFYKISKLYSCELRINTLKPVNPSHFMLLPSVKQTIDFIKELNKYYNQNSCSDPSLSFGLDGITNSCPCGIDSFAISGKKEDGAIMISPCVYLQNHMVGNLLNEDISDILEKEPFAIMRERHNNYQIQCREINCKNINVCRGGCAARAYLINNDIKSADPYCPLLFQNRNYDEQFKLNTNNSINTSKVHENYLCTWIGRARI